MGCTQGVCKRCHGCHFLCSGKRRSKITAVSLIRDTQFTKSNYDPFEPRPDMTARQKHVVKESWSLFATKPSKLAYASVAFMRVFILEPEMKEEFCRLAGVRSQDYDSEGLLMTAIMRNHLEFLCDFLDNLIPHLDEDKFDFASVLLLGQRHFSYTAHPMYLRFFCEGLLFSWEKSFWPNVDGEFLKAWEAFLALVAHHWALGYTESTEAYQRGIPGCPRFQDPKIIQNVGNKELNLFEDSFSQKMVTSETNSFLTPGRGNTILNSADSHQETTTNKQDSPVKTS